MLQGVAGRDEADSAGRTLANRRAFCSGARPKAFKKWRHSLGRFLPDELTGGLYLLIEANSNETMLEDEDFPAV